MILFCSFHLYVFDLFFIFPLEPESDLFGNIIIEVMLFYGFSWLFGYVIENY